LRELERHDLRRKLPSIEQTASLLRCKPQLPGLEPRRHPAAQRQHSRRAQQPRRDRLSKRKSLPLPRSGPRARRSAPASRRRPTPPLSRRRTRTKRRRKRMSPLHRCPLGRPAEQRLPARPGLAAYLTSAAAETQTAKVQTHAYVLNINPNISSRRRPKNTKQLLPRLRRRLLFRNNPAAAQPGRHTHRRTRQGDRCLPLTGVLALQRCPQCLLRSPGGCFPYQ
jgi:hypothetical protein